MATTSQSIPAGVILSRHDDHFENISSDSEKPNQSLGTISMIVDNLSSNNTNISNLKTPHDAVLLQGAISVGYASDDEASYSEDELHDSGRTRSSTRRANQISQNKDGDNTQTSDSYDTSKEGKGKKRKRRAQDGSDEDSDDRNDRSRSRIEQTINQHRHLDCSCPKDVMKCIGILPSLPIINHFCESDDSDSSLSDDLTHTVLPRVSRREGGEC